MYHFLQDLDAYFCQKFAAYDMLCVLKGYKMPLMQSSRVEGGKFRTYTLPANTMRLELQENKEDLLRQVKEKLSDKSISFSFHTVGTFQRLRRGKHLRAQHEALLAMFSKYNVDEKILEEIDVDLVIWQSIVSGKFLPSKNLLFTIALIAQFSMADLSGLFTAYGYEWDYAAAKDVVISYILEQKLFHQDMLQAALKEYKVRNLLFKA